MCQIIFIRASRFLTLCKKFVMVKKGAWETKFFFIYIIKAKLTKRIGGKMMIVYKCD
ncbi:hypothetical protein QFZ87_003657 [Bacillus sp. SLBN-46]|nr:hypothetical protein [Bacillus sp. SLBN-46]